jgi:hypothetical protein
MEVNEFNIEHAIAEAVNMHPIIRQCSADFPEKLKMHFILETEFEGDMKSFITNFMMFLIETEEFETAALVRDEFINKM